MGKSVSVVMLCLLTMSLFILAFKIQPVRAIGTFYILPDGSISPSGAPIQRNGSIYTLTGGITGDNTGDGIIIERDNIVVDGAGNFITPNGGNGIDLSGRSNVTIKNTNIQKCWYGIHLNSSSNNIISGNNISPNTPFTAYGIYLDSSSNYNIISGNNMTSNSNGVGLSSSNHNSISKNNMPANAGGVYLSSSNYNNVSENNIVGNWMGIQMYFSSNYNIISGNNITDGVRGIWMNTCSDNIISGNNIATNSEGGIVWQSSSGNIFFHNNFVNNNAQVFFYSSDCVDVWDNGYPSGGNYWSDYQARYPNATEIDSSGIWNTPYVIDANNTDRYPLASPYSASRAGALVPLPDTFVTVMKPSTLGWDIGIGQPYVIYDAGKYKMWYWAYDSPGGYGRYVIAYAESNDGITWVNMTVVHDAGVGYYKTMSPWVLKENGTYRMWHADYFEDIAGDWSFYIALMNSTDGINWPAFMSAGDQKVLSAQGQANPEGDGYDIMFACVLHESSGYVMWYSVNDHPQPGFSGPQKIWRATSTDGITWSNRTLSLPYIPGTWEGYVGHASVVRENDGTYTMFYGAAYPNGTNYSIGMSRSSDGISWVNRTQLLKPSDLGANITTIGEPFCFTDVNGERYLYFVYSDGESSKLGRIQLVSGIHDVAVTDVEPFKTVVGLGSSMKLNVTVANEGDFTEAFNLTASAVSVIDAGVHTIEGIESISGLLPGEIRTVQVKCNTTGLAYGGYTIQANASTVPSETNTANNIFSSNPIIVTIPGDTNGDKTVNVLDLILIATHLGIIGGNGYTPYTPDWYKCINTDLNNDGQHNVLDLIICATHLGQHW